MKQTDIVFERGKINIGGRRAMLIELDTIIAIQKEIEKKHGAKWKTVIYNGIKRGAEKVWLYYLGKKYLDIADHPGVTKITKSALEIFNLTGFGELELVSVDIKKGEARFISKNSSIAEKYHGKGETVCYFTAAMLAALMKLIFRKDLDCKEVKCKAKGDEYCEFVIQNNGGKNRRR